MSCCGGSYFAFCWFYESYLRTQGRLLYKTTCVAQEDPPGLTHFAAEVAVDQQPKQEQPHSSTQHAARLRDLPGVPIVNERGRVSAPKSFELQASCLVPSWPCGYTLRLKLPAEVLNTNRSPAIIGPEKASQSMTSRSKPCSVEKFMTPETTCVSGLHACADVSQLGEGVHFHILPENPEA